MLEETITLAMTIMLAEEGIRTRIKMATTKTTSDENVQDNNDDGNEEEYDPYEDFDIEQCDTYENLWLWDLSLTCESEQNLDSCECMFAEELMELELLSCEDSAQCPSVPDLLDVLPAYGLHQWGQWKGSFLFTWPNLYPRRSCWSPYSSALFIILQGSGGKIVTSKHT